MYVHNCIESNLINSQLLLVLFDAKTIGFQGFLWNHEAEPSVEN